MAPRVMVWTYEEGGFVNAPGAYTSREDAREFEVRRPDAAHVPTVVISYSNTFRESQGHRWLSVKVVVVDEDRRLFEELVKEIRKLLELEGSQPPLTADAIIGAVHEIFGVDEYSSEVFRYERDGYSRERLVYAALV